MKLRTIVIVAPSLGAVAVLAGSLLGMAWEKGSYGRLPRTSIHLIGMEFLASYSYQVPPTYRADYHVGFAGIEFSDTMEHNIYRSISIRVSTLTIVATLLLWPVIVLTLIALQRWRRLRRGLCLRCAYDL